MEDGVPAITWRWSLTPVPRRRRFLTRLLQRWQRHCQRRELLDLDDRMLRDIGVSRDDARLEARKRIWQ